MTSVTFNAVFGSKLKIVPEKQLLHINRNTKKVAWAVKGIRFKDKDTKQFVIYIPSLELTGYGNSEKKALEMLKFSVDDFFGHIIKLSLKEMNREIVKLGWKQDRIKKKDYSTAYVGIDGGLKDFNAEEVEFIDLKMTA